MSGNGSKVVDLANNALSPDTPLQRLHRQIADADALLTGLAGASPDLLALVGIPDEEGKVYGFNAVLERWRIMLRDLRIAQANAAAPLPKYDFENNVAVRPARG